MRWKLMLLSILGAVTGLIGAGVGIYNSIQAKKQQEQNVELAKEANETNYNAVIETNKTNEQIAKDTNKAQSDLTREINDRQIALQESTNNLNADIARETNAQNLAIANENLQFQKEQQEYEENLQKQIFEREDTAYQRTVNDMNNAGLSPLAMNGVNGAGAVVGRTPSNNNATAEGWTAGTAQLKDYQVKAYNAIAPHVEKIEIGNQLLNALSGMQSSFQQLGGMFNSMNNSRLEMAKFEKQFAETIRHNKKTEELSEADWKKMLAMSVSSYLKDKGINTNNAIDKTVNKIQEGVTDSIDKVWEYTENIADKGAEKAGVSKKDWNLTKGYAKRFIKHPIRYFRDKDYRMGK